MSEPGGFPSWTPSEVLFLTAPNTDPVALAELMLAAAFLANAEVGALILAMMPATGGPSPYFLDLAPGEAVPDWPAHSLEFQTWQRTARAEVTCVSDVVYDLVGTDTLNPPQVIIDQVRASFARRRMGPGECAAWGGQLDPAPVQELLARTGTGRPDVWSELFAEIRTGFQARLP